MSRIETLKQQAFASFFVKKEWWGDDLTILDAPGVAAKPLIMRKAMALEKVCREMPIEVKPNELIVGMATMSSVGYGHTFPRYETDEEAAEAARYALSRKSVWGHHMPYYPDVLSKGYQGVIAEIDARLDRRNSLSQKTVEFYEAVRHTLVAATEVPRRYVQLLGKLIETEPSEERRRELAQIRAVCRKVPAQPAESFQEALQSVWFVHMLLHSTLTYTPLGRIDQYLWPYYEADIRKGVITRDQAKDMIASFLVKFNERVQFRREHHENHLTVGDWSQGGSPEEVTTRFDMENDAEYTFGQSANHWLQSATVGGFGPDGKDATNELSYLFIQIINKLEFVSPMISARIHKDSPKEWLEFISGELCNGGAQPVLFNDDTIIKGLRERLHIPTEDALDYSSDGCWEVLIYGKTEYTYGHIEVMPCMEALLNNGTSMASGRQVGLDLGDVTSTLTTYEEFYQAFMKQVRHKIDTALKNKIAYYDRMERIAPEPYLSAFMRDCVENGRDLTDRGARYRIYSLFITGLSHCIDSLLAFKKLVYEDRRVSLKEAIRALKANWEGYEDLRQACLEKVPKYGNDSDEADAVLTQFLGDFCDHADYWNRKVDWLQVSAGAATFENYPRFGHNAWASFDGRVAHEAFSSNFSPAVGRDKEGPTAVLLSAAKFDLSRLNSGCPIDLRVSFDKEELQQSRAIMLAFIRSFIDLGSNIMTITKVDLETLKRAQKEPEKYVSLRVRLGGLTAYFVQLAKAQQDEYMRRTEHRM